MPLPEFEPNGLLPEGQWPATEEELRPRFGTNAPRQRLLQGVSIVLGAARQVPNCVAVVIDGSFVTDKDVPDDVDVVLCVTGELYAALAALSVGAYAWLLDAESVWDTHGVHVHFEDAHEDLVSFFQTLRPEEAILRNVAPDKRRGVVRVAL
jgi:hypothetical protein